MQDQLSLFAIETVEVTQTKPFLKWPGGKYKLLDRIRAVLPPGERLIEPFVGGGAVFLNTGFPAVVAADVNADLIHLYHFLQAEGEAFIAYCRTFFTPENNTRSAYNALRARYNTTPDTREKAALLVYLTRHCFNGLCRYNKRGKFNAPIGKMRPSLPVARMRNFYHIAQRVTFQCADFAETMAQAQTGDVVYCDPPYDGLSDTANFTSYSEAGFDRHDQIRLARMAENLADRGVPVVISNHDTEFIRRLYARAQIHEFDVQRSVGAKTESRVKVPELLAVFGAER